MLYYSLFGDKVSKVGVNTIYEALRRLESYPDFVSEILELTEYILSNLEKKTFAVGEGMPATLEQYGCYTREEVFAIFGRQTADKKMQGSVAGIFNIEELNTELFFVTLNKSDKDFSAETMYNDYVVSENTNFIGNRKIQTHTQVKANASSNKKKMARSSYFLSAKTKRMDLATHAHSFVSVS